MISTTGRHPSLYFEYFELRTDSGFFWPSYLTENNNSGSQSNKKDCIVTSQYARVTIHPLYCDKIRVTIHFTNHFCHFLVEICIVTCIVECKL